jgi:hypothetical protein
MITMLFTHMPHYVRHVVHHWHIVQLQNRLPNRLFMGVADAVPLAVVLIGLAAWSLWKPIRAERREQALSVDAAALDLLCKIKERRLEELEAYRATQDELYR